MAKRPRDLNELAKLVVDIASGEIEDSVSAAKRNPSPRGRAGGMRGGQSRAESLTSEERLRIARRAAAARWSNQ
jgi:hypothetical protein